MANGEGSVYIEYMPLGEIVGAARNPKEHDLGLLGESIGRFGLVTPLVIDERTGRLVAGHGRRMELMREKASGGEAPGRVVVRGDGEWLVPVIRGIRFADDGEAEAYLLADNRIGEVGGWDDPLLGEIGADLLARGKDMLKGVGFDAADVDELLRLAHGGNGRDGDERGEEQAAVEASQQQALTEQAQERWKVAEGDVYKIGDDLAVICGDCREQEIWKRLCKALGVQSADGVFTSPPYARQRDDQYGGVDPSQYVEWWNAVQARVAVNVAPHGSFFVNVKPHVEDGQRVLYVFDLVLAMVRQYNWLLVDEYCWLRNPPPGSWPNRFKNGFEPVYHFSKSTKPKFRPDNVLTDSSGFAIKHNNSSMHAYYNTAGKPGSFEWDGSLPNNVVDVKANATGWNFPAAFPEGLPQFFVRAFSDSGDTWIDPFVGSGTTLVAALQNERRAGGIETVPEFCALTVERLARLGAGVPKRV